MSNFIDFLLVISKLQSPIYCRSPQLYNFSHSPLLPPWIDDKGPMGCSAFNFKQE